MFTLAPVHSRGERVCSGVHQTEKVNEHARFRDSAGALLGPCLCGGDDSIEGLIQNIFTKGLIPMKNLDKTLTNTFLCQQASVQ